MVGTHLYKNYTQILSDPSWWVSRIRGSRYPWVFPRVYLWVPIKVPDLCSALTGSHVDEGWHSYMSVLFPIGEHGLAMSDLGNLILISISSIYCVVYVIILSSGNGIIDWGLNYEIRFHSSWLSIGFWFVGVCKISFSIGHFWDFDTKHL